MDDNLVVILCGPMADCFPGNVSCISNTELGICHNKLGLQ